MRSSNIPFFLLALILLIGCSNNDTKGITSDGNGANVSNTPNEKQNGITGEWEQQYTCFDKNGNYKLEAEEKKPSNTRLGFGWFKFNADGTCLRDKDLKFEGTYTIQEKNGNKKLLIQGGDNLSYTIIELTGNELILGAQGAFIIFKRIN